MDATLQYSHQVIQITQASRDLYRESVVVGDEHGLQGRFQQSVGSVLGHVLVAQGSDLRFADFKSLGSQYSKSPDVILKSC